MREQKEESLLGYKWSTMNSFTYKLFQYYSSSNNFSESLAKLHEFYVFFMLGLTS